MRLRKVGYYLVLVFMVCAFIFAGCGFTPLDFPETNSQVIGNGGIAVIKDNYLYYVNGYTDATTLTNYRTDNVYGKVQRSAIYKTKLNSNNQVIKNNDGFLENTSVVVPKVAGFYNSGFYIIGDYLYYITPNNEVTKGGTAQNGLIDFCKIKLDGTGNTRLATTVTDFASTALNWSCYNISGTTFIVYLDGTTLRSVDENGNKVEMATSVTSTAFLKQSNFNYGTDALEEYEQRIYYTRDITTDDNKTNWKGNALCSVKIGSTEETVELYGYSVDFAVKYIQNDSIYYTMQNVRTSSTVINMYKRSILSGSISSVNETTITTGGYDNVYIVNYTSDDSITNYAIGIKGKVVSLISNGEVNQKVIYTATDSLTYVGLVNEYLYFIESSSIYRLDILSGLSPIKITNSNTTYNLTNTNLIDLDGRRVFVMAEYTGKISEGTAYYLNIIDLTDASYTSKFVGDFEENDLPAKPEEATETDDNADEIVAEPWII